MRYLRNTIVLFFIFGLLIGCGTLPPIEQAKQDPIVLSKLAYTEALQIYYENALIYKMHFKAADIVTQAKWREKISPIFKEAKDALDLWKMFIDEGELPDNATLEDWKIAKTKISIKMNNLK
jgi:hypothetical protein